MAALSPDDVFAHLQTAVELADRLDPGFQGVPLYDGVPVEPPVQGCTEVRVLARPDGRFGLWLGRGERSAVNSAGVISIQGVEYTVSAEMEPTGSGWAVATHDDGRPAMHVQRAAEMDMRGSTPAAWAKLRDVYLPAIAAQVEVELADRWPSWRVDGDRWGRNTALHRLAFDVRDAVQRLVDAHR